MKKSQFLELRFHSKSFLILPTAQHISLPSLWLPKIHSNRPSKGIAWILQTFTHEDDHCESGNVLCWTEPLMHNSCALNYPRPSRIRLLMLQNAIRNVIDHSEHFPGYKLIWFCSLGIQSCTFHLALLLGLLCTPSQVIQSLSEAWPLTQSWAEMAGGASTLGVFTISECSPRPGIRTWIYLPHAQLSRSQGPHRMRSWEYWRDWIQPQNKSLVKY